MLKHVRQPVEAPGVQQSHFLTSSYRPTHYATHTAKQKGQRSLCPSPRIDRAVVLGEGQEIMKLTRMAVYRPVVALTVTLALTLFGIMSYVSLGLGEQPGAEPAVRDGDRRLPRRQRPDRRGAGDATARRRHLRRWAASRRCTSSSQVSLSQIIIEFEEGVNVDVAASDVQQKVSGARRELPSEVEEPSYSKLDFNDMPIVNLAVTSVGEADPVRLYRVANDIVRPRLEGVSGVGRVTVVGGREPEVQVEVQPDRLRAYGLTIADVTTAVAVAVPGDVRRPDEERQRRRAPRAPRCASTRAAATSPASRRSRSRRPAASVIELRNVANVFLGGKEPDTILRLNGQSAAGLLVFKQSSANITQTADAVLPQVAEDQRRAAAGLPAGAGDRPEPLRPRDGGRGPARADPGLRSSPASCCSSSCTASAARSS